MCSNFADCPVFETVRGLLSSLRGLCWIGSRPAVRWRALETRWKVWAPVFPLSPGSQGWGRQSGAGASHSRLWSSSGEPWPHMYSSCTNSWLAPPLPITACSLTMFVWLAVFLSEIGNNSNVFHPLTHKCPAWTQIPRLVVKLSTRTCCPSNLHVAQLPSCPQRLVQTCVMGPGPDQPRTWAPEGGEPGCATEGWLPGLGPHLATGFCTGAADRTSPLWPSWPPKHKHVPFLSSQAATCSVPLWPFNDPPECHQDMWTGTCLESSLLKKPSFSRKK